MSAPFSQSSTFFAIPHVALLFKACTAVLDARARAYRLDIARHSKTEATTHDRRLQVLLDRLGLAAHPVATQCFGHIDGATEHAVANIDCWMAFLPEECVGSMARDGWHWST